MKHTNIISFGGSLLSLLVLAAAGLSSCSKREAALQEIGGITPSQRPQAELFSYEIPLDEGVKTCFNDESTSLAWEEGDALGAYVRVGENVSVNQSSPVNTALYPRSVTVNSTEVITAGSTIYAYYPCSADNNDAPYTAVTLSIPEFQHQSDDTGFDTDAMPMVALPYTVSEDWGGDSGVAPLRMVGLGSVLCFKIYSSTASTSQIAKVDLMTGNGIAGPFTYDLSSPSCDAATDAVTAASPEGCAVKRIRTTLETPLSLDGADTKADALEVWMIAAPGTYSGTIRVYLNNEEGEAEKVYIREFSDLSFSRNKRKDINLDLSGDGTTIETSEGIWNADDLVAAKNAINEGSGYVRYQVDGKFTLMDDIDMSEVSDWTSVTTLSADFDGDGFSITHWATSSPLFETVASGVTVSDLTIDESCEYTLTNGNASWIAGTTSGTLTRITTKGTMSRELNSPSALSRVGTMAAICTGGTISDCTNYGDIRFHSNQNLFTGGIAGEIKTAATVLNSVNNYGNIVCQSTLTTDNSAVGGIVGWIRSDITLSDAVNYGSINYTANTRNINRNDHIGGICGLIETTASTINNVHNFASIDARIVRGSVAGIIGWAQGVSVENVSNKGNICADGNTNNATRAGIGGILGIAKDGIQYADNYGSIRINGSNSFNANVGGICGIVENGSKGISNCTNHQGADIILESNTGLGYIGGIVGQKKTNTQTISSCTNDASLDITSSYNTYIGGIAGEFSAGNITDCHNRGENLKANITGTSKVGGIAGNTGEKSLKITGSSNSSSIEVTAGDNTYVGGIRGYNPGTAAGSTETSDNSGSITVASSGAETFVGGILGGLSGWVDNCTSTSDISVRSAGAKTWIGGLAARNGTTVVYGNYQGDITYTYTGDSTPMAFIAFSCGESQCQWNNNSGKRGGNYGGTISTSHTGAGIHCAAMMGTAGFTAESYWGVASNPLSIKKGTRINGAEPPAVLNGITDSSSTSDKETASAYLIGGVVRNDGVPFNPTFKYTSVKLID